MGGPVARARQQRVEAQQPVDLAIDLVDACDQALLLFKLLEVDREFLLAVPPAADTDRLLSDLLGRKQCRLTLVLQLRLDVLAELPQALELVLVHGHADMADDALSDLAAVAHGLDDLDRASRAVGGGLDAHEHGGSVARGGGIDSLKDLLGTTTQLDRTATANSLALLKTPDARSVRSQPNRRSQEDSRYRFLWHLRNLDNSFYFGRFRAVLVWISASLAPESEQTQGVSCPRALQLPAWATPARPSFPRHSCGVRLDKEFPSGCYSGTGSPMPLRRSTGNGDSIREAVRREAMRGLGRYSREGGLRHARVQSRGLRANPLPAIQAGFLLQPISAAIRTAMTLVDHRKRQKTTALRTVPAPLRNTTQTSRIEISTQRKRSSHKNPPIQGSRLESETGPPGNPP